MTKSTWLKNKELKDLVGTINVVVALVLVIINVALFLILNK
jgi:hypothetical protein